MATVPLSGTNIRLLTGVPFNNDYKNTRWFDDKNSQTNYFLGKPTTYVQSDHNFQRIEGRTFIRVNKSIDSLWGTNYVMFQNTDYNSKWFYGFVTKLEYQNKNVTDVHFEIDVFQTWKFDMDFKPSFTIREHTNLWNSDGTPALNTIDEGLDYGKEYDTVSVINYKPYDNLLFLVIVSKEVMHNSASVKEKTITPVMNGMPQPLSYYVHPFKQDGSALTLSIGGESRTLTPVTDTLKGIFSLDPSVNNVVSIYVTEHIGRWVDYNGSNVNFDSGSFEAAQIADNANEHVNTIYVKEMPEYDSITENLGDKYKDFTIGTESKLLMYPYTVTILDDFKGNRIELKNEYIKDMNLVIRTKGSLGPSNKIAYSVDNYRTSSIVDFNAKLQLALEHSVINNSPNDVSILSDYLAAYLQGNRNTIENQKSSIMWNATMGSLTGGMVGMAQSTHFKSGANPYGVAAAGLEVVKGVGDGVIQMQGLQAKQRDIDNTPAQLVKMGGNAAFDFGNNYTGLFVIKKQITSEYRNILTNFFGMFGYKVNKVKVPNMHTRMKWNYVQTSNCNILGNMNNEDLTELKSVFDNGITLWHDDDVGNYARPNEVI
jgi:hypothetical protein